MNTQDRESKVWNRCLDPSHLRSTITGRCLNCKAASQSAYRERNKEALRLKQLSYSARRQEDTDLKVRAEIRAWFRSPPPEVVSHG